MPENYFGSTQIPPNGANTEDKNLGPQEPKFTPPSSNVFIRTSESDLEQMKSTGGMSDGRTPSQIPQPFTPPQPNPPSFEPQPIFSPPSPSIESKPPTGEFPQAPSSFPAFTEPSISPEISASEFASFPPPQIPKRTNRIIPILIIVGIITAGAALGYFVIWPRFFSAKKLATITVAEPTTTTTTTTLPPSPYPHISDPYQKNLINMNIQGSLVVSALKDAATKGMSPAQTFSVLIPKYRDYALSGEEVIMSLIPKLPDNLKPYLLARKYLIYAYYGEINPSLGLIVDIGEERVKDVKAIFAEWEKGKILDNLNNFWLIKTPKKTAKTFKETTTSGAEIRYFTYYGKEAAISYGFLDNYLIISSSLESINSAVSHLQGSREPIYP